MALESRAGRVLRICWETNGSAQERYMKKMAALSLDSGGCIKIDLKAWDDKLHHALCGVSNHMVLKNFESLSALSFKRPEPPLLIASTLLVPGYVDEREILSIASCIARLNPDIPYSLLAFHPQFYLKDLPTTSRSHALRCRTVAEDAGLTRVHIGNIHLLSDAY
jgi:pyruvate formate lyase activating enzyme